MDNFQKFLTENFCKILDKTVKYYGQKFLSKSIVENSLKLFVRFFRNFFQNNEFFPKLTPVDRRTIALIPWVVKSTGGNSNYNQRVVNFPEVGGNSNYTQLSL